MGPQSSGDLKMYFDKLAEQLNEQNEKIREAENFISSLHPKQQEIDPIFIERDKQTIGLHKSLQYIMKRAEVFLIDKNLGQDFYETPHTEQLYECTFKLPSPYTFVEFSSPIKVREVDNGTSKEDEIRGIMIIRDYDLFRGRDFEEVNNLLKRKDLGDEERRELQTFRYPSLERILRKDIDISTELLAKKYGLILGSINGEHIEENKPNKKKSLYERIRAFIKKDSKNKNLEINQREEEKKFLFKSYNMLFFDSNYAYSKLIFNPEMLPVFSFYRCYDWENCDKMNRYDPYEQKSVACWTRKEGNCERAEEFIKYLDLSMNIINYINSENVIREVVKSKFNKSREKEGRPQLRDYTWVRIDKTQAIYSGEGGTGTKHSVRYGVRPHFAFYHHCPSCMTIFPKVARGNVKCEKCGKEIEYKRWITKNRFIPYHKRGPLNAPEIKHRYIVKNNKQINL